MPTLLGGSKDKEQDGLDGVANFKQKHACRAVIATPQYLVIGGSKVHFYDKRMGNDHVQEIKTGTEITTLYGTHLCFFLNSPTALACGYPQHIPHKVPLL